MARNIMTSSPDRHEQIPVSGEIDDRYHIGGAGATSYDSGTAVDHPVPYLTYLVVVLVSGVRMGPRK